MMNTKDPDEIIKEFTLSILELRNRKREIEDEIKKKQAFLKAIKNKSPVKLSELYRALEEGEDKFWKIKEVHNEARANSYFEIAIKKEYFFDTFQYRIIEAHFMKLYKRGAHDIRIYQF